MHTLNIFLKNGVTSFFITVSEAGEMTPWFKTLGALGRAPARLTGAYSQYIWLTLRYLMTILHAWVHLSACLSPNLPAYSLYLKKKKILSKTQLCFILASPAILFCTEATNPNLAWVKVRPSPTTLREHLKLPEVTAWSCISVPHHSSKFNL